MKRKSRFLIAGTSGLLAAILIVLVRFVDVAQTGPGGKSIGLSHWNQFVFDLFGVNMVWYTITDWLGLAAILTAFLFAAAGFVQLVRRRSLLKVDKELFALAGLYLSVIGLYLLFEHVVVNYRPILMPGCRHPEASFPSSHTMLVCVIMGSAMMLLRKYMKKRRLRRLLRAFCGFMIGITVIGRLISGVHWVTDIIGGVLISTALLALFSGIKSIWSTTVRRAGAYGNAGARDRAETKDGSEPLFGTADSLLRENSGGDDRIQEG